MLYIDSVLRVHGMQDESLSQRTGHTYTFHLAPGIGIRFHLWLLVAERKTICRADIMASDLGP